MPKVITLLTDFGLRDYYVSAMKGVILSICPECRIVDITHEVPKFSIERASIILWAAYKYFPRGTIHVVVVDPGVGTNRRAVAIRTRNYYFIGPDNGVLIPAALDDGIVEIRCIENREFMRPRISATFHGRDVFAPSAAHLAMGKPFKDIGPEIKFEELVKPEVKLPWYERRDGSIMLRVVYVDDFGNLALSMEFQELIKLLGLDLGDIVYIDPGCRGLSIPCRVSRTFAEVSAGNLALYENSYGLAEVGVFMGSASKKLGIGEGDVICIVM